VLRALLTFRGLILVFGLVAVGLPIALVGELGVVRTLNDVNLDIARTRVGALAVDDVMAYQLDEETAIRGYAATRRPVFLGPYRSARYAFPSALANVRQAIGPDAPPGVTSAVDALGRLNVRWLDSVAKPILAGAPSQDALLLRGKTLIDQFRAEVHPVETYFDARYSALVAKRDRAIRTTTVVALIAIATIALEIFAFAGVVARMRRELDRERGFVDMLQETAAVRTVAPPHLAIGTVYRSATRGTRIGGDVYDVYTLDADRTLIVIGDASGKGLPAAVDTTFVRFAIRTLASEGLAPDAIVRRFDELYAQAKPPPEAFVSLFVGIHERGAAQVAYVNAGHEGCWVRRAPGVVEMLAPTGPIVGVGGLPFAGATTQLRIGDTLVLATDGLTEARDARGVPIPIATIESWIEQDGADSPQRLADVLAARVARYVRGRVDDDLAILAVRPVA
jgi:CHASE3 domain sensor protein